MMTTGNRPGSADPLRGRTFGGIGMSLVLERVRRKDRRLKLWLSAAVLLVPLGYGAGEWNGRNTKQMSVEQAIAALAQDQDWAQRGGALMVHRHAEDLLSILIDAGTTREPDAAQDAATYVGHLASNALRGLVSLRESRPDVLAQFRPGLQASLRDAGETTLFAEGAEVIGAMTKAARDDGPEADEARRQLGSLAVEAAGSLRELRDRDPAAFDRFLEQLRDALER